MDHSKAEYQCLSVPQSRDRWFEEEKNENALTQNSWLNMGEEDGSAKYIREGSTMEVFGIIGFIFGLAGVSMAIKCQTRIEKLEKKLKEKEVLGEDYNWKQKP